MTVLGESSWYQEILQKGQREDILSSIYILKYLVILRS
jgi:hypothetical protein